MIRESRIEDIPEIIRVIHESVRSCIQDHQRNESEIQIWLEKTSQSNLLLWILYNDSWVYIENDQIAGFIMVNDQGEILLNYIRPEMQLQGIGTALLMNMIDCLREKKIPQVSLDSTQTALPFYKKCGFQSPAMTNLNGIPSTSLIKYLA
ncbi:GNAT family N-acetyltransferase [Acinetobacter sp.]|jgi:N-acetylglutamate synthase-like GNAT family acetyltransferase|uniref:GNAT family N-acetyltransferase n=1 Tax=Acinetobacter sp. TaxID=472 RepID=UPI0035AF4657